MEQRVGKKIQKWDEVNGAVTETVDVTVEVPGDAGKANPMRSLEDQIEQNDNMLDGVVNNIPEEALPCKCEKKKESVLGQLNEMREKETASFAGLKLPERNRE